MRVLVFGAAGQLGRAVVHRLATVAEVTALTRAEVDVAVDAEVALAVESVDPAAVVNCAAYNAVDDAEEHAVEALNANAFAVLSMARAARRAGALLVHYGSDFVFDGEADRPYVESDPPRPQSHYAVSKLLGEWLAADAGMHYVLRVESLFGGERAKSSVDRILQALRNGEPARVFFDRTVTPGYVADVADATWRIIESRPPAGLYHCVNSGVTTWAGIAEEAARLLGVAPRLEEVSAASTPMRAKRPLYCALSNQKLRDVGIDMPPWQDALARYVEASAP